MSKDSASLEGAAGVTGVEHVGLLHGAILHAAATDGAGVLIAAQSPT